MPDTSLGPVVFLAFNVCRLDHSTEPPEFRVLHTEPEIYIRRDSIDGFAVDSRYGGAPCVKILVGDKTLFVLGPPDEIRRKLQHSE